MKKEPPEQIVNSIEFFLNPNIFGDGEITQQISHHLINRGLVVIRDAMQEAFAQRMFTCLDEFSEWKVYDGYEKHFHYHHHNIYDHTLFPPELNRCREMFQSDSTKSFMQKLSQRDCTGETTLSASLYLPGDQSLPHNDVLTYKEARRQVAFIWYLTKNWQPDWGGELFWCPKSRFITPTFNTLLLFNVSVNSMHFVTQVSPYARSKRLAINGWWNGRHNPEDGLVTQSSQEKPSVEFV